MIFIVTPVVHAAVLKPRGFDLIIHTQVYMGSVVTFLVYTCFLESRPGLEEVNPTNLTFARWL